MAKKYIVLFVLVVCFVNYAYTVEGASVDNGKSEPLKTIKDSVAGIEFIYVKGGCFQMGDVSGNGGSEEKPFHEVCVDDFYLGKYEITKEQWKNVMGSNPSFDTTCGANCPVDSISWIDTQSFLSKMNSKSGVENSKTSKNRLKVKPKTLDIFRLPTEAEWEYAARSGGKTEEFSGGNDVNSVSWNSDISNNAVHAVGTKAPNGLGIYDMSGNVWEWVNDWYSDKYYASSPRKNPKGPTTGDKRVLRGGSWATAPGDSRTYYRNYLPADYKNEIIGFRVLMLPPVKVK